MKKSLPFLISVLLQCGTAFTQQPDSLLTGGAETIEWQTLHFSEALESGLDISELTGILEHRLEAPLNLNDATESELAELGLLSGSQIRNLLQYRQKYGAFFSIYELKAIAGLGRSTLEKLMPFVLVAPASVKTAGPNTSLYTRSDVIFRFSRKLVTQAGFRIPADSLQALKSNSFFLGDPNALYLRYSCERGKHLKIGITADKDAGEMMFRPVEGLDAQALEGAAPPTGFDFYSGFVEIKGIGPVKSLIAGDFHAQFGQGLTLWSGLSFAGGSSPAGFRRYAPKFKANTSSNENNFLRGLALRLNRRSLDLSLFLSDRKTDARVMLDEESGQAFVSSIPAGGYHRSPDELRMKNALRQQHAGGNISYSGKSVRAGITACHYRFSLPVIPGDELYNIFRFSGETNTNAGINFEALLGKSILYGEAAMSANKGWAFLAGITHTTESGSILAVQYREYRKEYQNLFSSSFGLSSRNSNERGLRMALETSLIPGLDLQLYSEHYTYPWISSRMINPQRGSKNEVTLSHVPKRNSKLTLKYRYKRSYSKTTDKLDWLDKLSETRSHRISFRLRHALSASFSMKCQSDLTLVSDGINKENRRGSMISLDIQYHPPAERYKVSFRYALFNTDDYASRLYVYEHDVLYASSMPAYYGKGFRTYMLIKYSPGQWLDAWIRFSLTSYTDRNTISSGTAAVAGHYVPEIRLQFRIKIRSYRGRKSARPGR